MRLSLGPVDVAGNLWTIEPHARSGVFEAGGAGAGAFDLHVTRRTTIDAGMLSALCAGRSVGVLESAASFAARVQRLSMRAREIGVAAEWRWTDRASSDAERVDDDRAALGWFMKSESSLLVVEPVCFEKRMRLKPPVSSRPRMPRGNAETG
jgi:hypothetical protein